jgi:hypothetical protein
MPIDKQQRLDPKAAQRPRDQGGKNFAAAEPPLEVDLNACIKHVGSPRLTRSPLTQAKERAIYRPK